MGGYYSILFSHFINYRFKNLGIKFNVLAFGVETELFLKGSNSERHNKQHEFKNNFPQKYRDISNLDFYADEIIIVYGEFFIPDCYCALKFYEKQKFNKNVVLYSIKDCNHLVAPYINYERGYIVDFFKSYIFDNYISLVNQGNMHYFLKSDDLIPMFTLNTKDEYSKHYLLNVISKYSNFGLALNRLGVVYEILEKYDEAFKYFILSNRINREYSNTNVHLTSIRRLFAQKK